MGVSLFRQQRIQSRESFFSARTPTYRNTHTHTQHGTVGERAAVTSSAEFVRGVQPSAGREGRGIGGRAPVATGHGVRPVVDAQSLSLQP